MGNKQLVNSPGRFRHVENIASQLQAEPALAESMKKRNNLKIEDLRGKFDGAKALPNTVP